MFSLSVLIPNYNGRRHLQRLLPGVCRFAAPGTQILVIDDASSDDSVPWVRAHFPNVQLLRRTTNGGFCAAINDGLAQAAGEIVELLNSDTEVLDGWPHACLRHFADASIGSVAPLVLRMDQPDILDSAGQEYHVCGWAYERGHGRALTDDLLQPRDVFGPSASTGFYRRSALEHVGGLLPEYGAYLDDTDLAARLRWAGYRCTYEPGTRLLHAGGGSYGRSPRVTELLARNEEFVFWMNLPLGELLAGLLPHLGFQTVRLLRHAATGRLAPFLRGKWGALRAWRTILRRRREARGLAGQTPDLGLERALDVVGRGVKWLHCRAA